MRCRKLRTSLGAGEREALHEVAKCISAPCVGAYHTGTQRYYAFWVIAPARAGRRRRFSARGSSWIHTPWQASADLKSAASTVFVTRTDRNSNQQAPARRRYAPVFRQEVT
jgi:hypothetical protein